MCGIAGFLGVRLDAARHDQVLEGMLGRILHRGPDEQGYLVDGKAAIGNVRLSIIDLAHGSQPMSTPDGRYWIVFNGEIFNFKELREELIAQGADFRTHCDTEVVLWGLALEGRSFLGKMNGQFAICFYDRRLGTAIFARDRFGERPLFHTDFDGGLLFASEVKAFAAFPGFRFELDPVSVNDTMLGWSAVPGASSFKGISLLEPGAYAVYENGSLTKGYYDTVTSAAALAPKSEATFEEACAQIRAALTQSVRIRLRADLEVGAYVSGGLDSTITAMLAQKELDTQLRTFSIRFADAAFDEGSFQSFVQQQLGSNHSEISITASDYLDAFEAVTYHAEMPLYRLAPIPMYLLAGSVRASGLKVVLTGEGSDEFFLGYDIYRELGARLALEEDGGLSGAQAMEKVRGLYPYLDHFRDDNVSGVVRFFSSIAGNSDDPLFGHRPRHAVGRFGARLLTKDALEGAAPYGERLLAKIRARHDGFDRLEAAEKTMVIESETLLSGYLLCSQGDRMSAAHAVEARYPFIDHDVAAAALRLPHEYRLKGNEREKHILKEAFRDIVPDSIINRPKYPFRAPDGELMLDKAFSKFMPGRDEISAAGIFDPGIAERFISRLTPSSIGQREMQALTVLVSTQMLHRQFCGGAMPAAAILNNLTVRADLRNAA